ncbi:MAG: SIMPL domain-containing protein [Gemmatimonadetes bacterium]|nr:SIMPL domain-containing protein [Gemmatimonadota bacterium]MBT7587653.1 SIMPL domain-containing protein [Gemmatimonadota bacterium]
MQMKYLLMTAVLIAGISLGADAGERIEHTISVVGEGQASAVPDKARLSVGVITSSTNVREASGANRSSMQKMLQALADLGVEERDMATSNFSIHYENPRPKVEGHEGQYRVSNMLRVELSDFEQVDSVLEEVVRAGANQIWGVEMVVADVEALAVQARAKAAESARAKAEELARLHGRKLGEVLRITESSGGRPMARMMAMESGGGVIKPGEQSATVRLEVVYELR